MGNSFTEEELAEKLKDNPDLKVENPLKIATESMTGRVKRQGGNKYHVAPKEARIYNGRVYPSKKQAEYAESLDFERKIGRIDFYLEEVVFLLPGKTKTGKRVKHYVDFVTYKKIEQPMNGQPLNFIFPMFIVHFVEVKGRDLELGRWKRSQVEEIYKIKIEVV